MTEIKITDYLGAEHVIRTGADMNRLLERLERRREELADIMLGSDRGAALTAERESDRIEDIFLPRLHAEIDRVRASLDMQAADDHRRAKARAIKSRPKLSKV